MPHQSYIQRCLQLAQRAKGFTSPNPMVGAVLVHGNRVISEGYHHYYGAPHAEVNCLENVPAADKHLVPECTMYVNLEPCAHYGLTPPCATRIVSERIKKVVIANTDPFGEVSGRGIAILKEMGTEVTHGIMDKEGLWLNRRFFCFHTHKRPYIILKWAQTADGFIGADGRRQEAGAGGRGKLQEAGAGGSGRLQEAGSGGSGRLQITGAESQQLSHKWRTEESAIMVGYTTALNDNPQLTARLHKGRQPLRIALDRNLGLPTSHHLFNDDAATWIINGQHETISGNVHYIKLPFDDLLPALIRRLHDARILSVIVEGGTQLLNSFISAGLWDEARVFTGAMTIGAGVAAPTLTKETYACSSEYGGDTLQVYTNIGNRYGYVEGMEL